MRRLAWLATLSFLTGSSVVAQSQPDFSGHWVLVRPETAGPDVPRALIVQQPIHRANVFGNRLVIDNSSYVNEEMTSRSIQVLEYDAAGQLVVTVTESASGLEPRTTTAAYRRQLSATPTAEPAGLPAIERHRVGPVAIGGDAQTIYEKFAGRRELIDLGYEGMLMPALLLRFAGLSQRDGVVAELGPSRSALTVWRIEIRDPAFRTVKGIGVGSTVGQLRAAYRLDHVLSGEGGVGIRVEELAATFGLELSGLPAEWSQIRDPAQVPDSVKIKSVLLTR